MVTYTATVTDSSFPLKVTVSWYDYPQAEGFTGKALINDLDLEVSSVSANMQ
jgi:hypothetical protein